MIFYRSAEVRPGIEEACDSDIMFYEDLHDYWQTKDSLFGLMTESFNGVVTGIIGEEKSLLSEWLSFQ